MKRTIITDNVKLTPSDKDLIDRKLIEKLDKLLKDFTEDIKDATVKVDYFDKEKEYKVNFDMWLPGKKHIYAEESHEVLLSALTNLREDIERQIKEYKDEISI
jgi:ribosome-associated translation inhibitor RaiA